MRILFVGNDTGRTGAPIILLEIAKYFTAKGCVCIFVFEYDGVLTAEYQLLGKCFFWNINHDLIANRYRRWIYKAFDRFGFGKLHHLNLKRIIKEFQPQTIYGNTGISGYLIKEFHQSNIPTIMHLHEMDGILTHHCGVKFTSGIPFIDKYIAINSQIEQLLVNKYGVERDRVVQIQVFMPYDIDVNKYHKYFNEKFIVGSAGVPSHRKGTDLFIAIASQLKRRFSDIEFRWIGFDPVNLANRAYINDIQINDLQDVIVVTPPTTEPLAEFVQFDIMALCSREDPNPLVVLESGMLGKPVVCFKNSGATHQIAEEGGGIAVNMEDIDAFCDAIVALKSNRELYAQKSNAVSNIIKINYDKRTNLERLYSFTVSQCV